MQDSVLRHHWPLKVQGPVHHRDVAVARGKLYTPQKSLARSYLSERLRELIPGPRSLVEESELCRATRCLVSWWIEDTNFA